MEILRWQLKQEEYIHWVFYDGNMFYIIAPVEFGISFDRVEKELDTIRNKLNETLQTNILPESSFSDVTMTFPNEKTRRGKYCVYIGDKNLKELKGITDSTRVIPVMKGNYFKVPWDVEKV